MYVYILENALAESSYVKFGQSFFPFFKSQDLQAYKKKVSFPLSLIKRRKSFFFLDYDTHKRERERENA